MFPNGEGWYYLAVKKSLALLRRITLKENDDCCCLNCLHSFATENNRESHKNSM